MSSRNCPSSVVENEMSLTQYLWNSIRALDVNSIRLSFWVESMCQPTRISTVSYSHQWNDENQSAPHYNSRVIEGWITGKKFSNISLLMKNNIKEQLEKNCTSEMNLIWNPQITRTLNLLSEPSKTILVIITQITCGDMKNVDTYPEVWCEDIGIVLGNMEDHINDRVQ